MNRLTILIGFLPLLAACYEPYVKDFDYSGIYIPYQYDLRSVVVGEGMSFEIGAVLGGVIDNTRDREVEYCIEDDLITGSLELLGGTSALEGLKNSPSQTYVSSAISAAGLTSLAPLPSSLYSLDRAEHFTIGKGLHTGRVTFKADSVAMTADPHMGPDPYYAFGWKILTADADEVPVKKSFGIVAVRLENMFFGSWYHGGRSWKEDASGNRITDSETIYPATIPVGDGQSSVYTLSTSGAYTCKTDWFHNRSGTMTIVMKQGAVSVEGSGITDLGSHWNGARHVQDRKIYLNYKYSNSDGSFTVVSDTLQFRNRVRDGVNEWQN